MSCVGQKVIGILALFNSTPGESYTAEDRGKNIVEVVGDTACELTNRLHFLRLEELLAHFVEHGRDPATPAALVEKATLPGQMVITGTLEDLAGKVRAADVHGPTTIIVGEAVAYRVG